MPPVRPPGCGPWSRRDGPFGWRAVGVPIGYWLCLRMGRYKGVFWFIHAHFESNRKYKCPHFKGHWKYRWRTYRLLLRYRYLAKVLVGRGR